MLIARSSNTYRHTGYLFTPNFLGFAYRANTRHHFRPVLPMPGFSVSQGQNVCDFVQILLIVPL